MVKQKNTKTLKVWDEYEFKLRVPNIIDKNNKIEVFFSVMNPETGKRQQIKMSTGIDRYATDKIYTTQANDLIEVIIEMLEKKYDFINKCYPEYIKLTNKSTIAECIKVWLKMRKTDNEEGRISKSELDITGYVFQYYTAYLKKNNHLIEKPNYFTVNDINLFMRYIEKKRKLMPFTYNAYQSRLTMFFNYLIDERVITYNPSSRAFRYKTSKIKTRFVEFDDKELLNIQISLKSDPKFKDLYLASKLLYDFSIREAEQLRIHLIWINFESGMLILPEKTIENGKEINTTKNGMEAKFQLEPEHLELIKEYVGERDAPENFLYGGHNRPSLKQMGEKFLTGRWKKFREVYNLPKTMKMYALKHTGNYNSLDKMRPDQLSTINRHLDDGQIQTYIKKRKTDVIVLGEKDRF